MLTRTPYIERVRQAGCRLDVERSGGRGCDLHLTCWFYKCEFRRNLMALILIMLNCLGNESCRVWCRRLDIPRVQNELFLEENLEKGDLV